MSYLDESHQNSFLFTLANRVAQQTPYSIDQAILGVQGLLSFYDDEKSVDEAVSEFIYCIRQN